MNKFTSILFIVLHLASTSLQGNPKWSPNEIIVNSRQPMSNLSVQMHAFYPRKLNIHTISPIHKNNGIQAQSNSTRSYLVQYSANITPFEASKMMAKLPNVVYSQPNYIYSTQFTPNDAFYASNQTYLTHINLPDAWNYTTGNSTITIAVIDTGIQLQHEDLKNQLWQNSDEIEGNNIDDDLNNFVDDKNGWNFILNSHAIDDDFGHGTIVSGIIASETNNSSGVAGVCPNCKIMTLKAGNQQGDFTTQHVSQAILYAINNSAKVINLSLGGSIFGNQDTELKNAVSTAIQANIAVIGAAGNNSGDVETLKWWPATDSNVITVSALETANPATFASYSNYGSTIWLTAPGTSIAGPKYSQSNNTEYGADSGTSMSAPLVSGVAGLLLSTSPNLTPAEIKSIFQNSSTDLGPTGKDDQFGYGLLNALSALAYVDEEAPTGTLSSISTAPSNIPLTITGNFTDNMSMSSVPTASLYYRYLNDSEAVSDWAFVTMNRSDTLFTAQIPTFNALASRVEYYAKVSDIRNTVDIPALSNAITTSLTDLTGPNITFAAQENDFFSNKSFLSASVQDVSHITTESIVLKINESEYSIQSNSEILSFENSTLAINLGSKTFANASYTFQIIANDSLNNQNTQNIILQYNSLESSIYTPNHYDKPVNVPNPFNPSKESTYFALNVTQPCDITIAIYDLNFKRVRSIFSSLSAGYNEIQWDGKSDDLSSLPNGVYPYIITYNFDNTSETKTNKLLIRHW